jgi:large subunit ribosomal protein L15
MKLHDLRPAAGSRTERTRVGRGIAAGKGKTAGRGTKGQKARAGGSIPPWFEGGQTPLHQRIPKLRGFRNRLKVEYEIVNVGRIDELVEAGRIPGATTSGRSKEKAAPITVNQEILREAGAVRTLTRPLKVLGEGDVERALFVVADAFTRSAREKIESAGGTAQLLETPRTASAALGRRSAAPDGSAEDGDGSEPTAEATATTDAVEPTTTRHSRRREAAPAGAVVEAGPAADSEGQIEGATAGESTTAEAAATSNEPAAAADAARVADEATTPATADDETEGA